MHELRSVKQQLFLQSLGSESVGEQKKSPTRIVDEAAG
jgi:hypothetical protein